MKGLTLYQPYASLVAAGAKAIETRSWATRYRGPLLIHAARRWDRAIEEDCRRCLEVLAAHGRPAEPSALFRWEETLGRALAVAQVDGCEWSEGESAYPPLERAFADLRPGRAAWLLSDVRPVIPPVPCRGSLGLWEVSQAVLDVLRNGAA